MDPLAKEVSQIPGPPDTEELPSPKPEPDLVPEPPVDTVAVIMPEEPVAFLSQESDFLASNDNQAIEGLEQPVVQTKIKNPSRSRVVVEGGVSISRSGSNRAIPSFAVGLYDIKGTRNGFEAGVDIGNSRYYSLSYVFRVARVFIHKSRCRDYQRRVFHNVVHRVGVNPLVVGQYMF